MYTYANFWFNHPRTFYRPLLGLPSVCEFVCIASIISKRVPLNESLTFGARKKSGGGKSGEYGAWSMLFVEFLVTTFIHNDGFVRWRVVLQNSKFVCPQTSNTPCWLFYFRRNHTIAIKGHVYHDQLWRVFLVSIRLRGTMRMIVDLFACRIHTLMSHRQFWCVSWRWGHSGLVDIGGRWDRIKALTTWRPPLNSLYNSYASGLYKTWATGSLLQHCRRNCIRNINLHISL